MSDKQPQNVMILQEPEEDLGPRRWTFHRYLKGIVFGKWWILGSTIVLGVAGYLGGKFVMNPLMAKYSASFSYENVAITSDKIGGGDYVDGSKFSYTSLITEPTLNAIKASNAKYNGVDVNAIGATITMDSYKANDGSTVYVTPNKFTITTKTRAFPSLAIARSFFTDLIESPNVKAKEAVAAHKVNSALPSNYDSLSFEQQLSLIDEQRNRIVNEAASLTETFTAQGIINEEGKLISELQSDIRYAFSEQGADRLNSLKEMVHANKYFNYDASSIDSSILFLSNTAKGYKETLRRDCDAETEKKSILAEMKSTSGYIITDSQYASLIAQYEKEIADIGNRRLSYLESLKDYGYNIDSFKADPTADKVSTIVLDGVTGIEGRLRAIKNDTADDATKQWASDNAAFRELVAKEKTKVVGEASLAQQVEDAYQYLYKTKKSEVTYYNTAVITSSGSIPSALIAVAGAVVGFAISSLISAAVYIHKIDPVIDEKAASGIARKGEEKAE